MSKTQLHDEMIKWNKTEYSFAHKLYYSLIGKNFSLKKIECDVEIEFYGINDKMNKSYLQYYMLININDIFNMCKYSHNFSNKTSKT
jgi:hypothetical protein